MFSNEFVTGMTTPHRTRILGDLDENAPDAVGVGRARTARGSTRSLLLLRARRGRPRDARGGADARRSRRAGVRVVHRLGDVRPRRLRAVRVPRRDLAAVRRGPLEDGPARDDRPRRRVPARLPERVRPVHRPAAARRPPTIRESTLPRDAEGSGRADLGRNGSYLVFRQLRQDVPRVLAIRRRARRGGPTGAATRQARLRLAAKMVGRWPSGAPLTLAPDADDPSARRARTTSPTTSSTRAGRAARSARTSAARIRATRSTRGRAATARGR